MTSLQTAAQQALEILEELQGGCTDSDDGTVEALTVWCPEVVEALRSALATQAQPGTVALPHVIEERDAYASELAKCRDAFPIPAHGSQLEHLWAEAIGDPMCVAAYVQAAAKAQPAVPAGFVLVPVEPTQAYWDAVWKAVSADGWLRGTASLVQVKRMLDALHAAMLAASPAAPAAEQEAVAWRATVGDMTFHAASRDGLIAALKASFNTVPETIEPLYLAATQKD